MYWCKKRLPPRRSTSWMADIIDRHFAYQIYLFIISWSLVWFNRYLPIQLVVQFKSFWIFFFKSQKVDASEPTGSCDMRLLTNIFSSLPLLMCLSSAVCCLFYYIVLSSFFSSSSIAIIMICYVFLFFLLHRYYYDMLRRTIYQYTIPAARV